jgi:protein-disulfide isomerase
MKERMRQLSGILILSFLSSTAIAQQPAPHAPPSLLDHPTLTNRTNLPSEDTVNSFLQQTFGYNTGLSWKIADIRQSDAQGLAEVIVVLSSGQGQQVSRFYVTADGQHALAGDLMPFGARPFAPAREALEKGINGPSRGPATAPVTVVEFSDLQCPHCKEAQPVLDKLLTDEPNVRLVYQNFPLPQVHDWANKGADYADCVGRNSGDAFWKFIHDVYDGQATITAANADEKLTAIAEQDGAKGADIAACAAKPDTTARVEHSVALGKSVKITGTPTLFVNGRRIENVSGLPYDVLKQLVEFAAKDSQAQQAQAKQP